MIGVAGVKKAQAAMKDWLKLMEERGTSVETPMKPEAVAHSLNKFLRDDAIISSDSGTIASLVKRYGADVVLKAITSAGPDIVKAYNPLSYLCGTVRRRANVAKADALTAKLAGEMTLR